MKIGLQFVVMLVFISSFNARADVPVFGNTPNAMAGFNITYNGDLAISGGAVEFTPTENIDLNSVSIWLSGYNGQYDEAIVAEIWLSNDNAPFAPILSFTSPATNDGSLAEFTFSDPSANPYSDPSGSTILSANTPYWLVVGPGGGNSINNSGGAEWVGGSTPTGEAVYNGSDVYNIFGGSFNSSSVLPAFSINIAPEPSVATLMIVPLLLGAGRKLFKARKPLL